MTATEKLIDQYPLYIVECLRQRQGLEKDDTSEDEYLLTLNNSQVFKEVLIWNGLLGNYDSVIKDLIISIYGVNLDDYK